jgi:hypothetical protein
MYHPVLKGHCRGVKLMKLASPRETCWTQGETPPCGGAVAQVQVQDAVECCISQRWLRGTGMGPMLQMAFLANGSPWQ